MEKSSGVWHPIEDYAQTDRFILFNGSHQSQLQSKRPIVTPVEQLVGQPAASCEQTFQLLVKSGHFDWGYYDFETF